MKVTIEERKDNPLLDRKELKGTIEHEGEATPSEEALEEFLSNELGTDESKIDVDKIFTMKGMHKSKFWAKELGAAGEEGGKVEEETKGEGAEGGEEDYEEVLGGSIADAKEAINDMENPDYEKLMELEKDSKDRKGMKEFLEGKLGE